jgi:hypothetical protein
VKLPGRHVFDFAAKASFAVAALLFVAMLLSIFVQMALEIERWPSGRVAGAQRTVFRVAAIRGTGWLERHDYLSAPGNPERGAVHLPMSDLWLRVRFNGEPLPTLELWRWVMIDQFPFRGTNGVSVNITRWMFPMWPLVIPFIPLPVLWMQRRRRRARWQREGRCLECGYDLRATRDRCPECGNAVQETTP